MNPEVFREYDVRGVVDKDLDPEFVCRLGQAIGTYAARHGVRTMASDGIAVSVLNPIRRP